MEVIPLDSKAVEGERSASGVFCGESEDALLERFVVDCYRRTKTAADRCYRCASEGFQ